MSTELQPLRAITLIRPWSDAIVGGPKRVENRTWLPPLALLGSYIAIHAGAKYEDHLYWPEDWRAPASPPQGIVGVARLAGVLDRRKGGRMPYPPRVGPRLSAELDAHLERLDRDPWWAGPVGWLLTDVQQIDPIACRGALGLWVVPPAAAHEVRRRWKEARGRAA